MLGGRLIDEMLFNYINNEIKKEYNIDIKDRPKKYIKVMKTLISTKEKLSAEGADEVAYTLDGILEDDEDYESTLSLDNLKEFIFDLPLEDFHSHNNIEIEEEVNDDEDDDGDDEDKIKPNTVGGKLIRIIKDSVKKSGLEDKEEELKKIDLIPVGGSLRIQYFKNIMRNYIRKLTKDDDKELNHTLNMDESESRGCCYKWLMNEKKWIYNMKSNIEISDDEYDNDKYVSELERIKNTESEIANQHKNMNQKLSSKNDYESELYNYRRLLSNYEKEKDYNELSSYIDSELEWIKEVDTISLTVEEIKERSENTKERLHLLLNYEEEKQKVIEEYKSQIESYKKYKVILEKDDNIQDREKMLENINNLDDNSNNNLMDLSINEINEMKDNNHSLFESLDNYIIDRNNRRNGLRLLMSEYHDIFMDVYKVNKEIENQEEIIKLYEKEDEIKENDLLTKKDIDEYYELIQNGMNKIIEHYKSTVYKSMEDYRDDVDKLNEKGHITNRVINIIKNATNPLVDEIENEKDILKIQLVKKKVDNIREDFKNILIKQEELVSEIDHYDEIVKNIKGIKLDDRNNTLDVTKFKEYSEEIHKFIIDDDEKVLESLSVEVHEISIQISDLEKLLNSLNRLIDEKCKLYLDIVKVSRIPGSINQDCIKKAEEDIEMVNGFLLSNDGLNTIPSSYDEYVTQLDQQAKLIDEELNNYRKKRIEKEKEIAKKLQLYRSILNRISKYESSLNNITDEVNQFIDNNENEEIELLEYDDKIEYVENEINVLKELCIRNISKTINPEILDTIGKLKSFMLDNPHFKDQLSDYIIMQEKWIKENKQDYTKVDEFHEKEVELKDYYSRTVEGCQQFHIGDDVIIKISKQGVVENINRDGTYLISFDDGEYGVNIPKSYIENNNKIRSEKFFTTKIAFNAKYKLGDRISVNSDIQKKLIKDAKLLGVYPAEDSLSIRNKTIPVDISKDESLQADGINNKNKSCRISSPVSIQSSRDTVVGLYNLALVTEPEKIDELCTRLEKEDVVPNELYNVSVTNDTCDVMYWYKSQCYIERNLKCKNLEEILEKGNDKKKKDKDYIFQIGERVVVEKKKKKIERGVIEDIIVKKNNEIRYHVKTEESEYNELQAKYISSQEFDNDPIFHIGDLVIVNNFGYRGKIKSFNLRRSDYDVEMADGSVKNQVKSTILDNIPDDGSDGNMFVKLPVDDIYRVGEIVEAYIYCDNKCQYKPCKIDCIYDNQTYDIVYHSKGNVTLTAYHLTRDKIRKYKEMKYYSIGDEVAFRANGSYEYTEGKIVGYNSNGEYNIMYGKYYEENVCSKRIRSLENNMVEYEVGDSAVTEYISEDKSVNVVFYKNEKDGKLDLLYIDGKKQLPNKSGQVKDTIFFGNHKSKIHFIKISKNKWMCSYGVINTKTKETKYYDLIARKKKVEKEKVKPLTSEYKLYNNNETVLYKDTKHHHKWYLGIISDVNVENDGYIIQPLDDDNKSIDKKKKPVTVKSCYIRSYNEYYNPKYKIGDKVLFFMNNLGKTKIGMIYKANNGKYDIVTIDKERYDNIIEHHIIKYIDNSLFKVGDLVKAKYANGHYYKGRINRINENGTVNIWYDDKDYQELVSINDIEGIKFEDKWRVHDRMLYNNKEENKWCLCEILRLPIDREDIKIKTYRIIDVKSTKEYEVESKNMKRYCDTSNVRYCLGDKVHNTLSNSNGIINRINCNGSYDVFYEDINRFDQGVLYTNLSPSSTNEYFISNCVYCNYKEKGKYLKGMINRINDNFTYNIWYNEGYYEENVSIDNLRTLDEQKSIDKKENTSSSSDNNSSKSNENSSKSTNKEENKEEEENKSSGSISHHSSQLESKSKSNSGSESRTRSSSDNRSKSSKSENGDLPTNQGEIELNESPIPKSLSPNDSMNNIIVHNDDDDDDDDDYQDKEKDKEKEEISPKYDLNKSKEINVYESHNLDETEEVESSNLLNSISVDVNEEGGLFVIDTPNTSSKNDTFDENNRLELPKSEYSQIDHKEEEEKIKETEMKKEDSVKEEEEEEEEKEEELHFEESDFTFDI